MRDEQGTHQRQSAPHRLCHTYPTQLLNAGCRVTTIQVLLGHKHLNTTMTYARVHDQTVRDDYFRAMEQIEGEQTAVLGPKPVSENVFALLDKMGQEGLSDEQQGILDEVRCCLVQ